jgi:hypothetical protein
LIVVLLVTLIARIALILISTAAHFLFPRAENNSWEYLTILKHNELLQFAHFLDHDFPFIMFKYS